MTLIETYLCFNDDMFGNTNYKLNNNYKFSRKMTRLSNYTPEYRLT